MLPFGTRWHNLTLEFQSNHNKLSHWKWKAVSISYSRRQASKQKGKLRDAFQQRQSLSYGEGGAVNVCGGATFCLMNLKIKRVSQYCLTHK